MDEKCQKCFAVDEVRGKVSRERLTMKTRTIEFNAVDNNKPFWESKSKQLSTGNLESSDANKVGTKADVLCLIKN